MGGESHRLAAGFLIAAKYQLNSYSRIRGEKMSISWQRPAAVQAKLDKNKNVEAAGKELGYVVIQYIGGYDDQKRSWEKLYFYENKIIFRSLMTMTKDLVFECSDVANITITGQQQTNSRISVTRILALGIFSLAAPKKTTTKDTSVVIELKDGRQVLFHTPSLTEFEVHQKLINALSYYHSKQVLDE
ncbi:MAG TPA: hypothetical protein VIH90_06520 [Candidatus Saccharimonadales bacterium]